MEGAYPKKKRAIALAGGGPAVGLSIGALERLKQAGITFDVWSCSCVGSWLGVVYNQAERGRELETVKKFFYDIFRPDEEYARFPIAGVFAPDFHGMAEDSVNFVLNPKNYANLVVPEAIKRASDDLLRFAANPGQWNIPNLNSVFLNDVLAVNPISRFMTSLIFMSANNGLSRIYYPDSSFLKTIDFDRGVNITLGLPFVRTSPDHGTAFDLAGTGKANPESLMAALAEAGRIADNRARSAGHG